MRISLQIDLPETLNVKTDTSLLLAAEAKSRGCEVFWHHPKSVSLTSGGLVSALVQPLNDEMAQPKRVDLSTIDVVLIRQNPPFDMAYITNTRMLEALPAHTKVSNHPKAIREHPEKLFPLTFPELIPPTLFSASADDIRAFAKEQGEIVLKPLYGYGGMGVFKLNKAQENLEALLELWFTKDTTPIVAQQFIPAVQTAEKRIVLIHGEIAGAFQRIPQPGEIRSNTRIGGGLSATTLTPREKTIAETVGAYCKTQGLHLVGLDVIGEFLNEINITSPTGLMVLKSFYNTTPEKTFWDGLLP